MLHTVKEYADLLQRQGLLLSCSLPEELLSLPVQCLTYDTREMDSPGLFICKGVHFKEEYLAQALEKGAVAYISQQPYPESDRCLLVSDIRRAIPYLAQLHYNNAPAALISAGITGTKGKSTTAYYLRSVLNCWLSAQKKPDCAILSSIDTYDGVINQESHITTPEALELHRHFRHAADSGISHLVMEVSSQALKYGRVDGITFDVAAFLNIGTDHISPIEHADFEDYFSSKLKIFDHCKAACVNTDMDHAQRVLETAQGKCRVVTFGSHESDDVYCSHIEKRPEGIFFQVRTPAFSGEFDITMPGLFNVSNALCTIAMSLVLGIPEEYIRQGLHKARAGGRMQVYESRDRQVTVIVDYAHNRLSFEALFRSVKVEYPGREIRIVFGCPGYKAYLRRQDLGEIAGREADFVYITEEDSGEEPFESIAADIEKAVAAQNCPHLVLEDRGECIRQAVCSGTGPRLILLTGKGEETRQKRGMQYVDCPSDVDFTLQALAAYDAAHPQE